MELKELNGKVNYESSSVEDVYNEDKKKRMNDFFALRHTLKPEQAEEEEDEEDLEEDTGWDDISNQLQAEINAEPVQPEQKQTTEVPKDLKDR